MVGRVGLAIAATVLGTLAGLLVVPVVAPEAVPAAGAAGPRCDGRRATIVGTPRADDLVGTAGPDVIVTGAGDDVVLSRGGDDVVCTGSGSDRVVTGGGDDLAVTGRGDDWISSPGGADRVLGGPGDEVVDVRTTTSAPVGLVGGSGLNVLTLALRDGTGPVPVRLDQAAGTISVDGRSDAFSGWSALWLRGVHHWSYVGTVGPDNVIAVDGTLRAKGRAGNDVLSAGSGNDRIDGGPGRRDAAAVLSGANTCADVELGDCDGPSGTVPVLSQPSKALRASSTSA